MAGTTNMYARQDETQTLDALLRQVKFDLNRFEVQKLAELKGELESITRKKESLIEDYKKRYPDLLKRWREQHQRIENLHASLCTLLKHDERKCLFRDIICKHLAEIDARRKSLSDRYEASQGAKEGVRNEVDVLLRKVKFRLDELNANAQRIDAVLVDGDKLITEIRDLLQGPDLAVAPYLLWIRLLPSHMGIVPDEVTEACKQFAAQETPEKLCAAACGDPGSGDGEEGTQGAQETKSGQGAGEANQADPRNQAALREPKTAKHEQQPPEVRCGAWLMPPGQYEDELNKAWQAYYAAKKAQADAEADFRTAPDDIASLEQQLKDRESTLDARLRDELRKQVYPDRCKPPAA